MIPWHFSGWLLVCSKVFSATGKCHQFVAESNHKDNYGFYQNHPDSRRSRFIGPQRPQSHEMEVETELLVAVSVGTGVEVGGVGTLVVARAGEEPVPIGTGEPKSRAGDHKGPHPSPHHPRPYDSSVLFSFLPPILAKEVSQGDHTEGTNVQPLPAWQENLARRKVIYITIVLYYE
jgi:hypothetical protein